MKGTTDMSIQIPLSNLKKRGADYKPENTGIDKKEEPVCLSGAGQGLMEIFSLRLTCFIHTKIRRKERSETMIRTNRID